MPLLGTLMAAGYNPLVAPLQAGAGTYLTPVPPAVRTPSYEEYIRKSRERQPTTYEEWRKQQPFPWTEPPTQLPFQINAPPPQPGQVPGVAAPPWNYEKTYQWVRERIKRISEEPGPKEVAWRDFYRTIALSAMGIEPGVLPLDPLSQLRERLAGAAGAAPTTLPDVSIPDLIASAQAARAAALRQASSQLGVSGGYSGLLAEAMRAREALAAQAQAQYAPEAFLQQEMAYARLAPLIHALAQGQVQLRQLGAQMGI